MKTLENFLQDHFDILIDEWTASVAEAWKDQRSLVSEGTLNNQCNLILRAVIEVLPSFNLHDLSWEPNQSSKLISLLQEVGALWAHQGLRASETSTFIITLKHLIVEQLKLGSSHPAEAVELVERSDRLLDRLMVICHEAYIKNREKLIKQQSQALLELSTPVVKMWENMLLLPLIGVIDTRRARQITESLLREIADREALVTVMDLTGVPVFDTAVAGHLMKTIKAAQMLGCRVIMTGISPEGALVLTKLGIDFSHVLTRANLHSGVSEGFRILGLQLSSPEAKNHGI